MMGVTIDSPTAASYGQRMARSRGPGMGHFPPDGADLTALQDNAPPPGSTAIWVGIAAIVMMFAALTSALVVRQGASTDWHHFNIPGVLYINTLVLLASSFTLERFARGFRNGVVSGSATDRASRWLYATLLLGVFFVAGQYIAWHQLSSAGLYMASNPSHSFFYVLTGAHVLHLLGGLTALSYVALEMRRLTLRRSTLSVATTYWHFMDLLWLYLLWLLRMKM